MSHFVARKSINTAPNIRRAQETIAPSLLARSRPQHSRATPSVIPLSRGSLSGFNINITTASQPPLVCAQNVSQCSSRRRSRRNCQADLYAIPTSTLPSLSPSLQAPSATRSVRARADAHVARLVAFARATRQGRLWARARAFVLAMCLHALARTNPNHLTFTFTFACTLTFGLTRRTCWLLIPCNSNNISSSQRLRRQCRRRRRRRNGLAALEFGRSICRVSFVRCASLRVCAFACNLFCFADECSAGLAHTSSEKCLSNLAKRNLCVQLSAELTSRQARTAAQLFRSASSSRSQVPIAISLSATQI